jgi:Zn-dependent peptidase ImmA (M78 family)/transcriptional regulator with XRE-family HTH domain
MGRAIQVPITPSVLQWAITESGLNAPNVAEKIDVTPEQLEAWLRGDEQPSLTAFKKLAAVLRRPTATFLLPSPPKASTVVIQFRHPHGVVDRELLPEERLAIREVRRLQDAVAWLVDELGLDVTELPKLTTATNPEVAGKRLRELLGVHVNTQSSWHDSGVALKEWRRAIEKAGVLVFLLPIGSDAGRGFSLWNTRAPAIVANTHWNAAARIFTFFHELAHLLTRTNSVCADDVGARAKPDQTDLERWCERVAAAALMPEAEVRAFVREVTRADLGTAGRVANQFRVSLKAATLRLIDLDLATWALFKTLPADTDSKQISGGGKGRNRVQVRIDEYGPRTISTFLRGVHRDVIGVSDAMRYLDVSDQDLAELEKTLAA